MGPHRLIVRARSKELLANICPRILTYAAVLTVSYINIRGPEITRQPRESDYRHKHTARRSGCRRAGTHSRRAVAARGAGGRPTCRSGATAGAGTKCTQLTPAKGGRSAGVACAWEQAFSVSGSRCAAPFSIAQRCIESCSCTCNLREAEAHLPLLRL